MKILFINPPNAHTIMEYPDEKGGSYIETTDFGFFPPLGLLYVLSALEKNTSGHELYFRDCVAEKISHQKLKEILQKIRPDIVGITSFTISLVDVQLAAQAVRGIIPQAHICLGGHHPIAFPFEATQLPEFDSIVVGEGEVAFTELVRAIEKGSDITRIPGVYTAESIKRFRSLEFKDPRFLSSMKVPPAYIKDIDALAPPNRSYIRHIRYQSIIGMSSKLATLISSRGCPYHCIYCDVPYKQYRERSIAKLVDEIETSLESGYDEFHFYDDLFNITSHKIIAFCDEIEKRKMHFPWDFRGRVNTVTKESLWKAKNCGCRMISFGVETGSNEGLKLLRKQTSIEQIRKVFQWCKELKIKTIADFMIGLPFEKSREDVSRNIQFLIDLDPDYAQISILTLYPHTQVFHEAVEKGLIKPNRWEEFSLSPNRDFRVDHWEEFISLQKLVKLQKRAYRQFYMRPIYILKNIANIQSIYELKARAKGLLTLLK